MGTSLDFEVFELSHILPSKVAEEAEAVATIFHKNAEKDSSFVRLAPFELASDCKQLSCSTVM